MSGPAKQALTRYYKDYLRVCELWPADPSRVGRDFANPIRSNLGKRLENQSIDEAEAKNAIDALLKISTNYYKNKYPRVNEISYTNVSMEVYKKMMSNDSQSQVEAQKTFIERLFGVKKLAAREKEINEAK